MPFLVANEPRREPPTPVAAVRQRFWTRIEPLTAWVEAAATACLSGDGA